MSERRPSFIAQPGMTAWGRAAERELDAYVRDTALRAPLELSDRVMAAIVAESPTPRRGWLATLPSLRFDRLRLAGGMAVLVAMLGGAALVAGASAILNRDVAGPTDQSRDRLPVILGDPSATPSAEVADPPHPTTDAAGSPNLPERADVGTPGESGDDPDAREQTPKPEATIEPEEADEPEATDDRGGGGGDADEPNETDEPDLDSSAGGSHDDGGSQGLDGSDGS